MHRQLLTGGSLLIAALALAAAPRQAAAAIAHRYSFTADANDSVGAASGTVVDAGAPTAMFVDGRLDLSANNGDNSDVIANDAYVDFPNGMISDLASTAQSNGRITLEFWAQSATNRNWAALFSAGTSGAGENRSNGGGATDYIQLIPQAGNAGNDIRMTTHRANVGAEGFVDNEENVGGFGGALSTTRDQHIVAVLDQSGALPGTVTMYVDGVNVGASPIAGGAANAMNLKTFVNNNVWIGRSQWNDDVFDGFVNEFRVYDHAMTAAEASSHWVFGPDVLNPGGNLSIEVNKSSGEISLVNAASAPLQLDYYRIGSAGGALSAAWTGLDGLEGGDPPGTGWDKAGGSDDFELVELVLGESGATIAASSAATLGQGFDPSVFGAGVDGDLTFEFGLADGRVIAGAVAYVGGGGSPGDFDADLDVDGNDFLVWQRGASPGGLSGAQLAEWRANFGTPAAGAVGAVPEPSSVLLLMLAAGVLVPRRRSHA